ncbi:MAG: hypothetical protein V1889_03010 [archaeon]
MDDDGGYVVVDSVDRNMVDNRREVRKRILDVVYIVAMIFVIVFGLFIAYQLIRRLLGGSWGVEDLVLGLLMALVGLFFIIAISQVKLGMEFKFFRRQFGGLVNDLKRKGVI